MNIVGRLPASLRVSVTVQRGGGGLDRFGNPLPVDEFDVDDCLVGPLSPSQSNELSAWTDTDAQLFHNSFVFHQDDLVIVHEGQLNAGRWEVLAPSSEWALGTETRLRRVNQDG